MFKIVELKNFKQKLQKIFSKKEIEEYEKSKRKLKESQIIGKKLSYSYFRELKINGKRIYFLVYDNFAIILFINASNKKHQQETIDEIKLLFPEFKKLAEDIYNKKESNSSKK